MKWPRCTQQTVNFEMSEQFSETMIDLAEKGWCSAREDIFRTLPKEACKNIAESPLLSHLLPPWIKELFDGVSSLPPREGSDTSAKTVSDLPTKMDTCQPASHLLAPALDLSGYWLANDADTYEDSPFNGARQAFKMAPTLKQHPWQHLAWSLPSSPAPLQPSGGSSSSLLPRDSSYPLCSREFTAL